MYNRLLNYKVFPQNGRYHSSIQMTSVVRSWNRSWNSELSWVFPVTLFTCEKSHSRTQLWILFSHQEALSHLMASKAATLLMIVETVLQSIRDATCLTKRFLYLDFKFWIIPPSAGFSFKVILFGKNTKLIKFKGVFERSLDDLVGFQDKKGRDNFLVSSVYQFDQRSFSLIHLPSMTLHCQSNVIQPIDSVQLISENNVEVCFAKLQLG